MEGRVRMIVILMLILIPIIMIYKCDSMNNMNRIVEGYDDRHNDITIDDCAKFCKTVEGCSGFAYDRKNKVCYTAKDILSYTEKYTLDKDVYSPDKNEYVMNREIYSHDNVLCNKIDPIMEPMKYPPFDKRRANSLYQCSERRGVHPQLYLHDKNVLTRLDEGQNVDFITDIEPYEVRVYRWPRNKYDIDQIDLRIEKRKDQLYEPDYVTDMDRIRDEVGKKPKEGKGILEKIIGYMRPKEEKKYHTTYKRYNAYNNGDYIKEQCNTGVKLEDCLRWCAGHEECVGVEWNTKHGGEIDKCCPLKRIGRFVLRAEPRKHGNFYLKMQEKKLDKSNIYIYHE